MTLENFQKLEVSLPPYFVCFQKNMSKHETNYDLSYHFHGENGETINIWFCKHRKEVVVGTFDEKESSEWKKSKRIKEFSASSKKEEVEEFIKTINFKEIYSSEESLVTM